MDKKNPSRPGSLLSKIASGLMSIAFIVFVCWFVNGAAGGGHFLWWALAVFVTPIVLYLLFIALVGLSFVRHARQNVREAMKNRRER